MKPYLSMITLGVKDLQASVAFYRDGLGWPAKVQDDVAFIPLQNGVVLGLFGRQALAEDAGVKDGGHGFDGVTLAHNLDSPEAVDALFAKVEQAGAKIVKPPRKVFWGGYSGYFADPDGHLWEIAHNPFWKLNPNGSVDVN